MRRATIRKGSWARYECMDDGCDVQALVHSDSEWVKCQYEWPELVRSTRTVRRWNWLPWFQKQVVHTFEYQGPINA